MCSFGKLTNLSVGQENQKFLPITSALICLPKDGRKSQQVVCFYDEHQFHVAYALCNLYWKLLSTAYFIDDADPDTGISMFACKCGCVCVWVHNVRVLDFTISSPCETIYSLRFSAFPHVNSILLKYLRCNGTDKALEEKKIYLFSFFSPHSSPRNVYFMRRHPACTLAQCIANTNCTKEKYFYFIKSSIKSRIWCAFVCAQDEARRDG